MMQERNEQVEEEEDEEEILFVLTDEWKEFFAKSEAKRKLGNTPDCFAFAFMWIYYVTNIYLNCLQQRSKQKRRVKIRRAYEISILIAGTIIKIL